MLLHIRRLFVTDFERREAMNSFMVAKSYGNLALMYLRTEGKVSENVKRCSSECSRFENAGAQLLGFKHADEMHRYVARHGHL